MSEASLDDMLDLASGLAREAVAVSLGRLDDATAERKADNSLVTETDHAIQALILDAVAGAYPDHAVLAEETLVSPEHHADRGTARYCWVVDPLDGTRNYAAKFPCCSTSIAVLDGGVPVVGVVVEHHTGRLYAGACGRGVTLDGRAVRVA
ncbi:MAG: inositol monophosphatase family protein, partial [Phycisphaerae bacterium]